MVGVLRAYGYLADQCEESGDYRKVMSQIMHDYLFRCPNLRAAQLLQVSTNPAPRPVAVAEIISCLATCSLAEKQTVVG